MWNYDDPRWAQYAKHDAALRRMLRYKLPLTREVWLNLNYFGEEPGPHEQWTGEQESEVPEPLRDHTQVREAASHRR